MSGLKLLLESPTSLGNVMWKWRKGSSRLFSTGTRVDVVGDRDLKIRENNFSSCRRWERKWEVKEIEWAVYGLSFSHNQLRMARRERVERRSVSVFMTSNESRSVYGGTSSPLRHREKCRAFFVLSPTLIPLENLTNLLDLLWNYQNNRRRFSISRAHSRWFWEIVKRSTKQNEK